MQLQLSPKMIDEIAQQLDCGMTCFYNLKTGELESVPDEQRLDVYDTEVWQDTIDKIDENYSDYLTFKGMDSHESFGMMEGFIDEIPDMKLRVRFIEAIERKKPFQQFKQMLHNQPYLLQQWYAFKQQSLMEYVQEQIDRYNFSQELAEPEGKQD